MTTAAVAKIPYMDASPAELREAILPEDQPQFDPGYRRALDAAATAQIDSRAGSSAAASIATWSATSRRVSSALSAASTSPDRVVPVSRASTRVRAWVVSGSETTLVRKLGAATEPVYFTRYFEAPMLYPSAAGRSCRYPSLLLRSSTSATDCSRYPDRWIEVCE